LVRAPQAPLSTSDRNAASSCLTQAHCKPGPPASLLLGVMRARMCAAEERARVGAHSVAGPQGGGEHAERARLSLCSDARGRPRRVGAPGPRLQVQAPQQRPRGRAEHERGHDDDDQRGRLDRRQALLRRLPGPRRPAQLQHQAERDRAAQARAPQHQLRRADSRVGAPVLATTPSGASAAPRVRRRRALPTPRRCRSPSHRLLVQQQGRGPR